MLAVVLAGCADQSSATVDTATTTAVPPAAVVKTAFVEAEKRLGGVDLFDPERTCAELVEVFRSQQQVEELIHGAYDPVRTADEFLEFVQRGETGTGVRWQVLTSAEQSNLHSAVRNAADGIC
ncbi:hypothetical protein [Rhodococcus indonesiensis]|uniref:Lipoprotein n=1 Tax=Rhodococcus indonesiensis TaxID=3055869 RepID=A0ABT7RVG1_9NOCA|nr:hypothetical protein [Rhodococcus indonesiensis]MDM7491204.1 hypothetical protein [Rhodococcus indonesiensis]